MGCAEDEEEDPNRGAEVGALLFGFGVVPNMELDPNAFPAVAAGC